MRDDETTPLTIGHVPKLRNIAVYTRDGEQLGHVGDIYYDDAGTIEAVGVEGDAIGLRRVLVPVHGAVLSDDGLRLAYGRDRLEGAPEGGEHVDEAGYRDLREHYDRPDGVVRHEEELVVGTRPVKSGAVRLRKWVETQPVSATVQLKREVVRVVREPVGRLVGEHDFSEEEIQIAMHAEHAFVHKRAVAKERIGIAKDVASEQTTVVDEVRREQVEVEREDAPR